NEEHEDFFYSSFVFFVSSWLFPKETVCRVATFRNNDERAFGVPPEGGAPNARSEERLLSMKHLDRRLKITLFLLIACVVGAHDVRAQERSTAQIFSTPQVVRALEYLKASEPDAVDDQIRACEIPAPPFQEQKRAEHFKQRFTELGLKNVRIDGAGNVIGERPGASGGATLVLAAHLDTVFPEGTDVKVKRNGQVLSGPGIGDDCRGLAVILAVARALNEAKIETEGTILFVADVGEEGLGDLRGVRHL